MKRARLKIMVLVAAAGMLIAAAPVRAADAVSEALVARVLALAGADKGICSLPWPGSIDLAFAIARQSGLVVHCLETNQAAVAAARASAADAGLLGTRLYVEHGTADAIPFADNYVDMLVLPHATAAHLAALPLAEVMRVLTPRGRVMIGCDSGADLTATTLSNWSARFSISNLQFAICNDPSGLWAVLTKPPLPGATDWSHWTCQADNNLMSPDAAIKAPFQTQFIDTPYYLAAPSLTLAAAGRLFVLTGPHGGADFADTVNTIYCRNGYNGLVLWTRTNTWTAAQSSRMGLCAVAAEAALYLATSNAVTVIDARTGVACGVIRFGGVSAPLKWIAVSGGVLYALDRDSNQTAVCAYDLQRQRVLWTQRECGVVEERMIGARDGRLVYYVRQQQAVCRDGVTGTDVWRNATADLMKTMGDTAAAPRRWSNRGLGYAPGLVLTPHLAFLRSPAQPQTAVLSLRDGALTRVIAQGLSRNNMNVFWSPANQLIYAVLRDGTHELPALLDEQTAELVSTNLGAQFQLTAGMCTRMVATLEMDMQHGPNSARSNRSSCENAAAVGNGVIYTVSAGSCRCSQTENGQLAIISAPAAAATPVLRAARPEACANATPVAALAIDRNDWPVYRANNARSAATSVSLPKDMRVLWQTAAGPRCTPPVAAAGRVFIAREDGQIECRDAARGALLWRACLGGPVRMPPALADGRCYTGCGDGYLYCLEAATGRQLWRFRPETGPRRLINIYGALCSARPVNTGALVQDGVVYAGAGMNKIDGSCMFALEAATGAPKWQQTIVTPDGACAGMLGGLAFTRGRVLLAGKNQPSPLQYDARSGRLFMPQQPVVAPFYPVGREVMLFRDRWVVYGGNYLFAPPEPLVRTGWSFARPNTYMFFRVDDQERALEVQPFGMTAVPPAFDGDAFVIPTFMDGELCAWKPAEFDARLAGIEAGNVSGYERSNVLGGPQHQHSCLSDTDYRAPVAQAGSTWGPLHCAVRALALARNAVVCTIAERAAPRTGGRAKDAPAEEPLRWQVRALDKATGAPRWEQPLPALPLPDGLCIDRAGRVIVCLEDGRILCVGNAQEALQARN